MVCGDVELDGVGCGWGAGLDRVGWCCVGYGTRWCSIGSDRVWCGAGLDGMGGCWVGCGAGWCKVGFKDGWCGVMGVKIWGRCRMAQSIKGI